MRQSGTEETDIRCTRYNNRKVKRDSEIIGVGSCERYHIVHRFRPLIILLLSCRVFTLAGDFLEKVLYPIHCYCQISEYRLRCDGEDQKQHDTSGGHSGDSEQVWQKEDADQEADDASDPHKAPEEIDRLTDFIENHKADNRQKHGGGGGNIRRVHAENLSENRQGAHCKYIGQTCR